MKKLTAIVLAVSLGGCANVDMTREEMLVTAAGAAGQKWAFCIQKAITYDLCVNIKYEIFGSRVFKKWSFRLEMLQKL